LYKEESRKVGSCPKCHCDGSDIVRYSAEWATFRCWNCGLEYGQNRAFPYNYFRVHKSKNKSRGKKAIVAFTLVIGIIIASIVLAYAINDLSINSNSIPQKTPSYTTNFTLTTPTPIEAPTIAPTIAPTVSSPVTPQNLLVNPKIMHYHYTLRGVFSDLTFTVYQGMYDYLVSSEDSTVSYYGQQPSPEEITRILTLRYVNEGVEQGELHNLVSYIKARTPNEDDQARIAISLVQNIPYDSNGVLTNSIHYKYPYEVLYTNTGVCEQKSMLLVCLLRELGYGCSILEFPSQNHAAVGIACPAQYAYYSGYAFVESTTPSIITDWQGDYVGAGKLPSSPSYVIVIQDGKVMNSVSEEYQDNQAFQSLINMGSVLDESHYTQWQAIVSKYGLLVS
jgi:hypothetical protein